MYCHFEEVLKRKWVLAILAAIRQGVTRPGAIRVSVQGLTKKILYERLYELERLGSIRWEVMREKAS
ncbi:winged helix-turn-helix transcriptional regulator [Candidatus Caldatribacterium sp.]|uniref:winged helix-turn-helix transcriptional regulator n=1 Tax=Candidatus Caldatribacterium sp. TaxID=2282143 RepID=UPI0029923ACF|nr:winged helix-turn-helix transcriptional regulator [Candidatus Caldatribacterium sp.]MDW8081577.1 winged helix-turn-helix transcriptional regulator [Candidatus Calescibacterium sp.]